MLSYIKYFKWMTVSMSAFLISCASQKNLESNNAQTVKQPSQQTASRLSAWQATGAIAAKQHKRAWSATLSFQQYDNNHFQIHLFGPIGSGSVTIEKNGALLTYRHGEKIATGSQAMDFIHQETGVRFPFNQLSYWIRGLPAPGPVQFSQHDQQVHLTVLKQAGYTLYFLNYTRVQSIELPTKIRLESAEGVVKVVIKQWKI